MAGAKLRKLVLRAWNVTTLVPLAAFARSLESLDLRDFHVLSRLLSAELSGKKVKNLISRTWPALPHLEKLCLHAVLRERDMHAVFGCYPHVDGSGSSAADTHKAWER